MSGLSSRGERFVKAGSVRTQLTEIWENVYHEEHNSSGTINLGTAENYVMLDNVTSFINNKINFEGRDVDYGAGPWGSARMRNAMAKHMNKYFDPLQPVDASDIVFSTGCTSICDMLGFTLFESGEGILLSKPIYQAFQNDFNLRAEVKCIFVSFGDLDQFTVDAVRQYEAAIEESRAQGIKVRAMIICNPHNPLGRCYEPAALIEYMKLCQKHSMHLIVDEIYALSTYDLPGEEASSIVPFKSILSMDVDKYIDSHYLHLLYGFSKDFAGGGLRLGCIWTRNEALNSALSSLTIFSWPSNLCERIGIAMLEDEEWLDGFVQTNRKSLGERSAMARSVLQEYGIGYDSRASAGFFLWIDLRKHLMPNVADLTWEHNKIFKKQLHKHKVYITSGDSVSSEAPGFFRLCFVKPEKEVRAGVARVASALKEAAFIIQTQHSAE